MKYSGIGEFEAAAPQVLANGPVAMIFAEDSIEISSTILHHLRIGFGQVLVFADEEIVIDPALEVRIHRMPWNAHADNALLNVVNRISALAPAGAWLFYCYNAEYLLFPFCETRTVRDLLTFHTEERRDAMLTYVIDLYARDLTRFPNAVSLEDAHLDRMGYYSLARQEPLRQWEAKERQLDFFGGLRWRFEEHVSWGKRKIDRISLFRARAGLMMSPEFTFNDEEYNTYACPWHHNLTACVCSFRTAKALRTNPGSRDDIPNFHWHGSTAFSWGSQQLMDLGLMEPGQWF